VGNLYEYFSAADDEEAAAALGRKGWTQDRGARTLAVKGIDPAVQIGRLEELLTGRPYAQITADPRFARRIGPSWADRGVVTLTDTLTRALAAGEESDLAQVTVDWSQIAEFDGQADPMDLAEFLFELSAIAARASERGHRLYCRWSR